jgi:Ig-like domain CHU_C associated/CARDB
MKRHILLLFLSFIVFEGFSQKKTYEYDELNRLTKAYYWEGSSITTTITYTYDEVGNRLTKVVGVSCALVGGTVSPATQNLCQDNVAAGTSQLLSQLLILSGHSGNIIRWEYQTPSSGWNDWGQAGETTGDGCCFGGTIGTWKVRAVIGNGSCPEIYSSEASIVVLPLPLAPSINSPIINSGQTATLTAAGCSGIVNWYSTTTGGASIASGTSFTTPVLTNNTTYYADCSVNSCPSVSRGSSLVSVCQLPDLIISDVIVTKYSTNRIDYRVVVKNIGNQTVNLGSFAFSTYGSTDAVKDNTDTFKNAMFLGGGNLAKDQTINYDVFASIDYKSPEHYFVLLADHYASISECDENNNSFGKVVKLCTHANNSVLNGSYGPGLIAANGYLTLNNVIANPNTLFLATAINGNPKLTANNNNVSFVVGTCLQQGFLPSSNIQSTESARLAASKSKDGIEFTENSSANVFTYQNNSNANIHFSIWDMEAKVKLNNVQQVLSKGNTGIDLSKFGLIKGKNYILHFESVNGKFAKVITY